MTSGPFLHKSVSCTKNSKMLVCSVQRSCSLPSDHSFTFSLRRGIQDSCILPWNPPVAPSAPAVVSERFHWPRCDESHAQSGRIVKKKNQTKNSISILSCIHWIIHSFTKGKETWKGIIFPLQEKDLHVRFNHSTCLTKQAELSHYVSTENTDFSDRKVSFRVFDCFYLQ